MFRKLILHVIAQGKSELIREEKANSAERKTKQNKTKQNSTSNSIESIGTVHRIYVTVVFVVGAVLFLYSFILTRLEEGKNRVGRISLISRV